MTEKKDTKKAEEKTKKVEFRTQKDKNFVGFVHPSTRKLVTVDKKGKLLIDETDVKALEIARSAVDLVEI